MPSDPMWINAGKNGTVGTATIAAATDLFTITAHGLVPRERVVVDTLTGGAVGVLDEGLVYYVVDVLADTFALSTNLDGPPVLFASDGGAAVYRFAPQYSAVEMRRALGGLLHKGSVTGTPNARFGARGGAFPNTNATIATVTGTTWEVINLNAGVYPGLTGTSGPYIVQHPTESGSTTPADGTNDRIDALDLQIQDNDEDASGFRRARVVYAVGTPAGTPVPPALTANSLRVATILVGSGGTPAPVLTVVAPWTVTMGGVLPVRDTSELPAFLRYEGMVAYQQDIDTLLVWNGSAWVRLAPHTKIPSVHAQITADVGFGTSETTIVTAPAITGDGTTKVKITISYAGISGTGIDGTYRLHIKEGGTFLMFRDIFSSSGVTVAAGDAMEGGNLSIVLTPSSASHTYSFTAIRRVGGAGSVVKATATAPAQIMVEQFGN